MENKVQITILPYERTIEAYEGDSLHTILLVAGIITPNEPSSEKLRLEKGSVSETKNPEAEAAIFTPAQLAEGWMLATERRVLGDAVFTIEQNKINTENKATPLASGYGMVVDMGTATLASGLINLNNIRLPFLTNIRNSQADLAPEIEERLAYCINNKDHTKRTQALLRQDINNTALKLCNKAGIKGGLVDAVVMVGNYSLSSIMQGKIPPNEYPPLAKIIKKTSAQMGINSINPKASVYLLPAISPQLGSDTTSAILATNLMNKAKEEDITILIDLGMRSEIIAAGRGKLLATSVPTPAFEGAGLSSGMSARTGAITKVSLGEKVTLRTIRDARPIGICGAGMLSLVHELLKIGMLDSEGRLLQPKDLSDDFTHRFRGTMRGREFVLSWATEQFPDDVCINQNDIYKIQLAKAAVFAACQAILKKLDASIDNVSGVLLAESSTANINPKSALAIGFLPPVDSSKIISIGNAAWQGGFLALTNQHNLDACEQIAKTTESLDLTSDIIYAQEFINGMNFNLNEDR